MRRATKTLAFMLVFIMVIATFAGLNLYDGESKDVYADSLTSYKIVKIGNASGTDITDATNMSTIASKIGVSLSNLTTAEYELSDVEVVEISDEGGVEKKTVNLSKMDVINGYDMVIVDLDNSCGMHWETAFELYCRIIGLNSNGNGMKFLINTKAFSNPTNSGGILTMSGGSNFTYQFLFGGKNHYTSDSNNAVSGTGYSKPIEKLFLMLNTYNNPAVFYSLFCTSQEMNYGIDITNGKLKGMAESVDENKRTGGKSYDKWSLESLKPYWMMSSKDEDLTYYGYSGSFGLTKLKNDAYCGATNKGREYGTYYFGDPIKSVSGLSELITDGQSQLGTIIKSDTKFYADGGMSLLVVQANYRYNSNSSDTGLGVSVTGGIAREIYDKYMQTTDNNHHMKPPIGGVNVDLMSMYEFNATTKDLNAFYDAIYFGKDYNSEYSNVQNAYKFSGAYAKSGIVSIHVRDEWPEYVNGVFNNWQKHEVWEDRYMQGNDLSVEKEKALNSFDGVILRDSALTGTDTKVASTSKISSVPQKLQVTGGNFNSVAEELVKRVETGKASITLISSPTLYTAENYFELNNHNTANEYYFYEDKPNNGDYINGYDSCRDLVFTIKAESLVSGTYRVRLLLDLDADGFYDKTSEGQYIEYALAEGLTDTIDAGEIKTFTFTPLPNNYVGSVPWRLDLMSGAKICDSIEGMSACKEDNDKKVVINVLQIVADGDLSQAAFSSTDSTRPYNRNTLYIPTKDEIAQAKNTHNPITSYTPDTASELETIRTYFDGALDIQQCSLANVDKKYNSASEMGAVDKVDIEFDFQKDSGDTSPRNTVVYSAGLFYYFMANLDLYELNTQRISLYQLENCWRASNRSEEGDVVSGTTKVAGWDKENGNRMEDFTIKYDKSTGEISYTDCDGNLVKCDVLIAGFSDSMVRMVYNVDSSVVMTEELPSDTVNMISKYILKNHNALVGRGIVNSNTSEALTQKIREYIGMAEDYTLDGTSLTSGNGGNAEVSKTNEGSLTRFPYSIPESFNTTNTHMPIYNVDINDTEVAGYYAATVASSRNAASTAPADYAVGNIEGNYYMYRKKNLTYVNIGFAESQATGQKSSTIKLPEAGLLANTIANYGENRNPGGGTTKTPDINVINPGTSKTFDDNFYPIGGTKKSVKEKDYFYIDYEVNDTGTASSAMEGDKFVYVKDGVTYQRVIFTASNGPATLELKAGDKVVNVPIYEYNASSNTIGSTSTSELKSGGTYAVDVPISQNYYTGIGASGFGFGGASESFTINATIKPKTGASVDKSSFKEFVFTKRGLFMIN